MGDGGRCSAPRMDGSTRDRTQEGPGNKNSRKARGLAAIVPYGGLDSQKEKRSYEDLNARKRDGAGT